MHRARRSAALHSHSTATSHRDRDDLVRCDCSQVHATHIKTPIINEVNTNSLKGKSEARSRASISGANMVSPLARRLRFIH
jgi:hypothetical protein